MTLKPSDTLTHQDMMVTDLDNTHRVSAMLYEPQADKTRSGHVCVLSPASVPLLLHLFNHVLSPPEGLQQLLSNTAAVFSTLASGAKTAFISQCHTDKPAQIHRVVHPVSPKNQ